MPSKKKQKQVEKHNRDLAERIDFLKGEFEHADQAERKDEFRYGSHRLAVADTLEAHLADLQRLCRQASEMPEDTNALAEAMGTSPEGHAQLYALYWTAQAERHAKELTRMSAGDMAEHYLEALAEDFERLGVPSFQDGLDFLGVEREALQEEAQRMAQFWPERMVTYVAALNEELGLTETDAAISLDLDQETRDELGLQH